jgi:hypothetical protein
MRRFFFVFALAIVALLPHLSLAQSTFIPLAPIPGLTQGVTANSVGTVNFLNNLYKFLIGIAAVLAVLEIMWGGFEYATKDSVSKKSDGKKRIQQALFGLALVLLPVLVFGIINPQILNLSISMGPLNVQNTPGAPVPTPTVTQTVITRQSANNDQAAIDKVNASVANCQNVLHGTPKLSGVSPNIVVTCQANTVVAPGTTEVSAAACAGLTKGQVFADGGTCANPSGQVQTQMRFQGYSCVNLTGGGVCLHG